MIRTPEAGAAVASGLTSASQSEEPETIIGSGGTFDIDLTTVNKSQNSTFDSFEIEMLGYACPDGSANTAAATATLFSVGLSSAGTSTATVGPIASPGVTSPWSSSPIVIPDSGPGADAGTNAGGSTSSCATSGANTGAIMPLLALGLFACSARRRSQVAPS